MLGQADTLTIKVNSQLKFVKKYILEVEIVLYSSKSKICDSNFWLVK